MDRRFVYVGGIVLALIALSLVGMTPQVLYQRAQEMFSNAGGAAEKTRHLADKRQSHVNEATGVLDDLPGEKKDRWTSRN